MPAYQLAGLVFELPWSLPLPTASPPSDIVVTLAPARDLQHAYDPSEPWPVFEHRGADQVLVFPGLLEVHGIAGSRKVIAEPDLRADENVVKRLVLEHFVPRALATRHDLVMHASAAQAEHGVAVFIGPSGRGKSTLAAHLGRRGLPVLADDALVVEVREGRALAHRLDRAMRIRLSGLPHWLDATAFEQANAKVLVAEGTGHVRFADEPAPIARVFVIDEPADELEVRPLSPRDATLALLTNLLHFGEEASAEAVDRLLTRVTATGLASQCSLLRYPRRYDRIEEVCDAVLEATRSR